MALRCAAFFRRERRIASTTVTVSNSAKFALPNAGGMGTTRFTVGGASLILLGAAVLVLMQKKHSA